MAALSFFTSNAAVNARPVVLRTISRPSRVVAAPPRELPHTGADLPLTGAVATGLLGLALVVRRRRTHL